ncbi:MAG: DEAD/DEAH box helicase family protein, partial [Erysipelotrichaceae bacterium]
MKRRLSQIKNKKKFLFFLGIYCILLIIDMKCPRCNNEDEEYFYHGSKGWYCRKCIRFKRILLSEELTPYPLDEVTEEVSPYLSYELTDFQKEISKQLCASVFKEDVLLHCVCGAGKTEIVLEAISAALNRGCKVAYAISRRQVVLELSERFKIIFPNLKVIAVCQGFTNELSGDLIVCTTHQLYRYPETFDLLIIDEPDAFPFKGDETLWNIAHTSCKGHVIYSTATLDQQMNKVKEKGRYLCLNRRPHLYP